MFAMPITLSTVVKTGSDVALYYVVIHIEW